VKVLPIVHRAVRSSYVLDDALLRRWPWLTPLCGIVVFEVRT
jgi:hypothetical protein